MGQARPTRGVPVLVDDDFVLAESAAIVEYIDERWPSGPTLFARDPGQRLASGEGSTDALNDVRRELALWEDAATGESRSSELSAVDLAVYPCIALFLRLPSPKADFVKDDVFGPRLALWRDRMQTLPIVQWTWPLEMSRFA